MAARVANALRPPLPGTVKVVHVHGSAADPPSIILPGRPTQLLTADDVFRTNVRALMQQSVVIYLGFSLGPEEFPLRDSVAWLTSIPDGQLHILVIPADRAAERGAELEALTGIEHVEVVTYDATQAIDTSTRWPWRWQGLPTRLGEPHRCSPRSSRQHTYRRPSSAKTPARASSSLKARCLVRSTGGASRSSHQTSL